MKNGKEKNSIIVTYYNEEESTPLFYKRIIQITEQINFESLGFNTE